MQSPYLVPQAIGKSKKELSNINALIHIVDITTSEKKSFE